MEDVISSWYYRQTQPAGGECSGPQSGDSAELTELEAATDYTYGLYLDSACASERDTVEFTTKPPPPSIAAAEDSVTEFGATLTAANVTGDWHYRQIMPEAGECAGPESGASVTLSTLEAAADYTYGLYSDAACANELDRVEFTTKPSTNAGLAALGLSAGTIGPGGAPTLSPAFSPDADAYSASLPFAAPSLLLTPQTAHPDATARIGLRGGALVAVPADGAGTTVAVAVGQNAIVIEITAGDGVTTRTVNLAVTRAAPGPLDATAARTHLFPLFADGGGFRSRLLVSDAVGERGRCELTLHGAGLDAVRFAAEPAAALPPAAGEAAPDSATAVFGIRLGATGEAVLNSAGAGELALGHARLECDAPAAAQLLLTLETDGALTAMANQEGARRGTTFSVPDVPAPLRLAFANDGAAGNLCVLDGADGRSEVTLPPGEMMLRPLDEILPRAGGGGSGPVSVRCERPLGLLALLQDGNVFTVLPAVVLPEEETKENAGAETMYATATDAADALLPLVLDGGGFRSRLIVTNQAAVATRCDLRLSAAGGLAAANFAGADPAGTADSADGAEDMAAATGFAFELALEGRGAQAALESLGGDTLAFGHATLECEGPATLQNLIVLDGPDGPSAMMALNPAQPAGHMRFRAPPTPARLALVAANGGGERTACSVSLATADGAAMAPVGFPLLPVAAQSTAIRFLDEFFDLPADFAGGAATLRCDHPVGAVALPVAGPAFTATPPIIPGLETLPEE